MSTPVPGPQWWALGLVGLAVAGCPGSPGDSDDTDPATPPAGCTSPWSDGLGADPQFDAPHGMFALRLGPDFGSLSGAVADGPPLGFHVESARSGACRLLTYTPSSCEPTCAGGDVCLQGSCVSPPERLAAGQVFLHTSAGPVGLDPDGTGSYSADTGPAAGSVILVAEGDEIPAFELQSCAVTAPVPASDWPALFAARSPGADVTLTWSDPDPSARVQLRMTTGVGTHGGIAHAEIDCEGADTGALTLPGAWLDTLYAEGWSCGECGDNELFRVRADQVEVGGHPVRLWIGAPTRFTFRPSPGG